MDPAKYWMLARRKLGDQKAPLFPSPHITVGSSSASYYESWEERAFAEDSAGHLGGCIWPPRSYSCSFCGREFRSAQALGGHMNVHRRDRARLKLSGVVDDGAGSESNNSMPSQQSYILQPCPPQTDTLQHAYSPNPSSAPRADTNPNSICSVVAFPARSLIGAARTAWGKHVMSAPLASPTMELAGREYGNRELFHGVARLGHHERAATRMGSNPQLLGHVGMGKAESKMSILGCRSRREFINDNDEDDEEEMTVQVSHKRRIIDLEVTPLVLCCSSSNHQQEDGDNPHHEKVLKLCRPSSVEDVDLELRLGEAPKILQLEYFNQNLAADLEQCQFWAISMHYTREIHTASYDLHVPT